MIIEDMNKEKLMSEIRIIQREDHHGVTEVAVINVNGKKCIKCAECGALMDVDIFNKIIDTFDITENASSYEIVKYIDNLVFVRNLIKGREESNKAAR